MRAARTASLAAIAAVMAAAVSACGKKDGASVRVTIPPGASMAAAAESLHSAGVIGSPRLFRSYAKLRGSDRGIKAGTYLLRQGAGWNSVLSALRAGRGVINVVTIPEGFTLAQTENLLASKLAIPVESLKVATRDTTLLERLGIPRRDSTERRRLRLPEASVEGYLFPDTYYFSPGTSARAIVETLVRRFEERWKPEWNARMDTFALTRHEVMTLASIVEEEAKIAEERPMIAAVYWNRLRKGMLLQADPTVQYALPQYQSRLLNRHLTVRSPYNTYRYPGLPPGPIAAPGEASIVATLFPADVPYLYFVAYPDGHHEFRTTLAEHQAAARRARRAWDAAAKAQAAKAAAGANNRR